MAKEKKTKTNAKKVDTILVVLIAIIVLAIIALGIVLVISINTSDVQEPPKDTALVTDKTGSYSNYLTKQMKEIGLKELPISAVAEGQNVSYTYAVLGTDDNVYLVSPGENPNEISGGSDSRKFGNKYALEKVVDIFGVETTTVYYVYAITSDGTLYQLDLVNGVATSNTVKVEVDAKVTEVFAEGNGIIARTFDNNTVKLN